MNEAVSYDAERVETIKTRLKTALDELKVTVDENRFEQELIFYLEKYDITEEKVRQKTNLKKDEGDKSKAGFRFFDM